MQLKELPEKWANTKRLSVTAKQQVAPLQGMEIGKLKTRIDDYDKFQKASREKYLGMRYIFPLRQLISTKRFYFFNCKSPYEHLSEANTAISELETQVAELQSQAALFEVQVGCSEQQEEKWLGKGKC